MSRRNIQNEKLDCAAREIFKNVRVGSDEIEKIVAAPQLFSRIQAEIKTAQARRDRQVFFRRRAWNWQTATAVCCLIVVFAVIGGDFLKFAPDVSRAELLKQIKAPNDIRGVQNTTIPALDFNDSERAKIDEASTGVKNPFVVERAVFKSPTVAAAPRPMSKPRIVKTVAREEIKPPGVFYPLTFTGSSGANGDDVRIIRTEISRAALSGLGVSVPLENEPEKVKIDLLMSSDGVVKAVRFVK